MTTATDVYGLGAILYALLDRPAAVRRSDASSRRWTRCASGRPSRREANPRVPRDLEIICLKCLEKDPSRRYASAQALADDLQRFPDGKPITARAVSPLEWSDALGFAGTPTAAGLGMSAALISILAAGSSWPTTVN